jgi:hypothetical protein
MSDSVALEDVGVSIIYNPNGTATVKVDDREQTIQKQELESSPLYNEAIKRISSHTTSRLGQPYQAFRPTRFIRWWLLPTIFFYVLVFHLWQPRRPYIEGGTQ